MMANGIIATICFTSVILTATADDGNTASDMLTTSKPLECHSMDSYLIGMEVRSIVDCAIKCLNNLCYCTGYVVSPTGELSVKCHVCWIYDAFDELFTAEAATSATVYIPRDDRQKGKIKQTVSLSNNKSHCVLFWSLQYAYPLHQGPEKE